MYEIYEKYTAYSKSASGGVKLTPNFTVAEFACQDGTDPVIVNDLCVAVCQAVRNWFGYPFTPNSAYRTTSHNKAVGGASNSHHVYGRAVDIPAIGITPKELYDFIDRLVGNSCEVGIYSWGVHVGIQAAKKRFTDSSYKG